LPSVVSPEHLWWWTSIVTTPTSSRSVQSDGWKTKQIVMICNSCIELMKKIFYVSNLNHSSHTHTNVQGSPHLAKTGCLDGFLFQLA
jgi:hypothetical protein